VLRRVPHHRDAHVARRADRAQGELALLSRSRSLPLSLPFFLSVPSLSCCLEAVGLSIIAWRDQSS
jgi:hypothetical protein